MKRVTTEQPPQQSMGRTSRSGADALPAAADRHSEWLVPATGARLSTDEYEQWAKQNRTWRAALPADANERAEADAYAHWDGLGRAPTRAMRARMHDLGGPLPVDDEGREEL